MDPFNLASKTVMIIVIGLNTVQTFQFMRIFGSYTPIVVMLNNVFWDLKVFLLFYTILIFLFSIVMSVIGYGNGLRGVNYLFWKAFHEDIETHTSPDPAVDGKIIPKAPFPGVEYVHVGLAIGNFFDVFRISLGDYASLETAVFLSVEDNFLYWIMWLLIVVIGCIIFLNFIIAEASHSYEVVSERLEEFIQIEKAKMIGEAEGMRPSHMKSMQDFPKFIIIR